MLDGLGADIQAFPSVRNDIRNFTLILVKLWVMTKSVVNANSTPAFLACSINSRAISTLSFSNLELPTLIPWAFKKV